MRYAIVKLQIKLIGDGRNVSMKAGGSWGGGGTLGFFVKKMMVILCRLCILPKNVCRCMQMVWFW